MSPMELSIQSLQRLMLLLAKFRVKGSYVVAGAKDQWIRPIYINRDEAVQYCRLYSKTVAAASKKSQESDGNFFESF